MKRKFPDGGPAFPGAVYPQHPEHSNGMSMRDWFAGQALLGIIVDAGIGDFILNAKLAYDYADAMLEARNPDATQTKP